MIERNLSITPHIIETNIGLKLFILSFPEELTSKTYNVSFLTHGTWLWPRILSWMGMRVATPCWYSSNPSHYYKPAFLDCGSQSFHGAIFDEGRKSLLWDRLTLNDDAVFLWKGKVGFSFPTGLFPIGHQHIPRSPWHATGGWFSGSSGVRSLRTWLHVVLFPAESSLFMKLLVSWK